MSTGTRTRSLGRARGETRLRNRAELEKSDPKQHADLADAPRVTPHLVSWHRACRPGWPSQWAAMVLQLPLRPVCGVSFSGGNRGGIETGRRVERYACPEETGTMEVYERWKTKYLASTTGRFAANPESRKGWDNSRTRLRRGSVSVGRHLCWGSQAAASYSLSTTRAGNDIDGGA